MKNKPHSSPTPPKWAETFFCWYCREDLQDELLGDLQERFDEHHQKFGLRKARRSYWLNVFLLMNRFTLKRNSSPSNTKIMLFSNYLSVAFRNMRKHPMHTFVNIFGLGTGLACCLLIYFYLQHEKSYDQFHIQSAQIYRVNNIFTRSSGEMRYPLIPPAVAPALGEGFPEIQKTTRLRYDDGHWFEREERRFFEDNVFFADSNFLKVFSFGWVDGDMEKALSAPNNIVLTEKMAQKYFGSTQPIGKTITLDGEQPLIVSGVMENLPSHSHIQFDFLISFQSFEVAQGNLAGINSWAWLGFLTYVLVEPQTNLPNLENKLTKLFYDHSENRSNLKVEFKLQPLTDIYMGSSELSNPYGGMFRTGNSQNLYALSIVGLLILFIAGFNFMNLSLAISTTRNREVGIRKVLGATQNGLLSRFLSESVLVVLLSFVLGIIMMEIAAPILQSKLDWYTITDYQTLIQASPILIIGAIIIGILTGLYPSLVMARFKPLSVLKDQLSLNISGKLLRKGLIGTQFTISISLLIAAVVISQQLQFARNKQLGFDKEHVINTRISGETQAQNYEILKQTLLANPDILGVSRSSHTFGDGSASSPIRTLGAPADLAFQISYYQTDYDFLDNMNIKLKEGRYFSPSFPADSVSAILVNETLVKTLELENPIGQKVIFASQERTIIGVIEDFHYASLHHEIGPFALVMPFGTIENVLIKVAAGNLPDHLQKIEKAWLEVNPDQPFTYQFLDDRLENLYEKEEKYASLIMGFSLLAILIASLGLYSLMTFSIRMRMKEIGIRKVLGASTSQIMLLLSKQFIVLMIGANLIAWPISAYFMQKWLTNFAYSIDLHPGIFIASSLAVILIIFLALSFQTIKGARSNPVKVLRMD